MSDVSVNVTVNLLITQAWTEITKPPLSPHSIAHQVVRILPLQGLSHLTILFILVVIALNQALILSLGVLIHETK